MAVQYTLFSMAPAAVCPSGTHMAPGGTPVPWHRWLSVVSGTIHINTDLDCDRAVNLDMAFGSRSGPR